MFKTLTCTYRVTAFVEKSMNTRQHFFLFLISLFFFLSVTLFSKEKEVILEDDKQIVNAMGYGHAFIYGLVEGVTEFLPISSTGHLVLVREYLSSEEKNKEALNAYLIVIQAGAILAVTLIYRKQVLSMILGFLGFDPTGKRLALLVLTAFLPAAILGPIFDKNIETYLFGLLPIAIALALGALLMLWAERRRNSEQSNRILDQGKTLEDLTFKNSFIIGIMQCVAMCPGTSRSMMTIVGGYVVGLQRKKAAEFSFLLGLVTLTAAAAYKVLTKWSVMEANLSIGPVFFGCLIAGISAALSVFWLVNYLSRNGLMLFVWYRMALSLIIFIIYFNTIG